METRLIEVGRCPTEEELRPAAACIAAGGLVAFPTETVYGLGGNAYDADAAARIYAAKGRPSDNPLIVHVADPADTDRIAETSALFWRLAARFWPGPFTMILPKKDVIPASVTGGLDTVAVRCPSDAVASMLIRLSGVPIAAPSANLSGHPSPTAAKHVIRDLYGRVDMIVCGEDADFGVESTVVRLDGDALTLLRPGAVSYEMLCREVGQENVSVDPVVLGKVSADIKPQSPGMKYRHYAPTAPVILLRGDDGAVLAEMKRLRANDPKAGFLVYEEDLSSLGGEYTMSLGKRDDVKEQAHRLFDCLRRFDETDVSVIYAPVPTREGIGLAVYNRLGKAAGFEIITL